MKSEIEIEEQYNKLLDKWDQGGLSMGMEEWMNCLAWVLGDVEWCHDED